ncbi:MAG TPA: 5'/3'-nucleotidase SurE [Kiloniellaceae bacterium]|nr:5'/3'-nucleotidase SurE [Kiloniellaceae bacterium]
MADQRIDLAGARILVTNDDGILAPGLKVLERIAKTFSKDVWVVAPAAEQSAASHSLTLRRPLRVQKLGPRRFTVDGTPTDCVLVAQHKLLTGRRADIVLSGVNHGANLGEDISYSGTVAAAKEAAYLGVPAVAFSQCRDSDGAAPWDTAAHYGIEVLRQLSGFSWRRRILVNVNFPALKPDEVAGIAVCPQGERDAATSVNEYRDPVGRPYLWIGDFSSDRTVQPDSDLGAVAGGKVALTPLHLDSTHDPSLGQLRGIFA